MRAHAVTNIGLVRTENQDACTLRELPELSGIIAVVCDGMGGAAGGRIASSKAIEYFTETLEKGLAAEREELTQIALQQIFADAVYRANREVFDLAVITPELQGMGTTLTAVLAVPNGAFVANIGDSRVYMMRGGRLKRLTHDDSYVQKMMDEGRMTEEEALTSHRRHLLTRALGTKPYTDFRFDCFSLLSGDRLLLCSDGLTGCCRDEEICRTLSVYESAKEAAGGLIAAALAVGAPDNVTAVVIDI